jgi:hypothetical protein
MRVTLADFCQARSGDKADTSDISLFAPSAEAYAWIAAHVTADRVAAHFTGWAQGPVHRYEVPNVWALKFVIEGALGGGGPASLRVDTLGKAMGSALLRMEVDLPPEGAAWLRRKARRGGGPPTP